MYNSLFDRLWLNGINPFGNPFSFAERMENHLGYDDMSTESLEFVKGNFKTTVVLRFNKDGLLVSHKAESNYVQSDTMKLLKDDLHDAIEKEDFLKAAEIQKKINKVREKEEQKPTL